jgi:hypothetical protein
MSTPRLGKKASMEVMRGGLKLIKRSTFGKEKREHTKPYGLNAKV